MINDVFKDMKVTLRSLLVVKMSSYDQAGSIVYCYMES